MSDTRDRRREALLDELRRLHRAEPAPEGLRRRVIEQAERGVEALGPLRRAGHPGHRRAETERFGSLTTWLGELARPRVAVTALAVLGGAIALRPVWNGALSTGADSTASAPELEIRPEPKGAGLRSASPSRSAAGDAWELRDLPFDARESSPPLPRPADADSEALEAAMDSAGVPPAAVPSAEALPACPLAQVPRGAVIMPRKGGAPGLTVHTFEQQTHSCGPLTRRYLEQLPAGLPERASAPVLILLHDAGEAAETMRARRDRLDFERIARTNGAVLIYANAAPGGATRVGVADSGAWQTDPRAHLEINDDEYLVGIVGDLTVRHVIEGSNDIFLVGYGDGASMALEAAVRLQGFTGVAAFAPSNLSFLTPALPRAAGRLSRVMLMVPVPARGAADAWRATMPMFVRRWASVLGLEQRVIGHISHFGDPKHPSGSLEQFDVSLPATGSSGVRVYVGEGAIERPPGALHAWDFLTGRDGADAAVPDNLPDLPVEPLFADGASVTERDADGYEYPSMVLEQDVVPAPSPSSDSVSLPF